MADKPPLRHLLLIGTSSGATEWAIGERLLGGLRRFPVPVDTALLLPYDYAEHLIGPQHRGARARLIRNIMGPIPTRH